MSNVQISTVVHKLRAEKHSSCFIKLHSIVLPIRYQKQSASFTKKCVLTHNVIEIFNYFPNDRRNSDWLSDILPVASKQIFPNEEESEDLSGTASTNCLTSKISLSQIQATRRM